MSLEQNNNKTFWSVVYKGKYTKIAILSIASLFVLSCSTIQYTPAETAQIVQSLQDENQTLKALLDECESDLGTCVDLLKECAPLTETK